MLFRLNEPCYENVQWASPKYNTDHKPEMEVGRRPGDNQPFLLRGSRALNLIFSFLAGHRPTQRLECSSLLSNIFLIPEKK